MAHARLAPSSAKRWVNCPASVALIEKLPPQRAGYAAAEGTVAHAIHEEYHTGKIDGLELVSLIGTKRMCDGHEVEVTEEMIDSAVNYHEAVLADIAMLELDRRPNPDPARQPAKVVSLTEAKVKAVSIDPECEGTADKIVYQKGKKLIVRDLKFGKGAVEVEENEQMSVYAIGTMDTLAGWAFNEVELIVDQPRAKHEDGRERRWITTPAALKEFAAKAKAAAAETRNPNAQLKAGPWCQSTFCPVRSKCPAVHQQAQASAVVAFSDPLPALLPEQSTSQEKRAAAFVAMRLPEVRLLSDTQVVDAFRWREAVTGFFDAIEESLLERLAAGAKIDGVKLVDARVNRKWINEDEVVAKWGEEAYEKKLLSPSKMETLKGKKAGVDAMTFKPEPKKLVVLATDARPEARVTAQEAFAEIETSCAECDVMGTCSAHEKPKQEKKREPIWPA